jgi:hypothetical protein
MKIHDVLVVSKDFFENKNEKVFYLKNYIKNFL